MSMSYGLMVSGKDAIEWMEKKCWPSLPVTERHDQFFSNMWSCCMNRFRYEIDKAEKVPVRVRKGRREDYSCGNCGHVLDVGDKYCPNCGTAIDWNKREVINLT